MGVLAKQVGNSLNIAEAGNVQRRTSLLQSACEQFFSLYRTAKCPSVLEMFTEHVRFRNTRNIWTVPEQLERLVAIL